MLTLKEFKEARGVLSGVIRNTSLVYSPAFSKASAAGTGNRAWHHDRICAETDQLCTQPEKADDHIDRNFSGRCGHRYDQTHRTGVQDGRNRHPPHR